MARDAISRLYDVQKNTVTLTCDGDKGSYRPGMITFHAKPGRSIDLVKLHESIAATRLSGGTRMEVTYLEITATGSISDSDGKLALRVAGTGQEFRLEETGEKAAVLKQMREALARGQKISRVTGRVQGWSGVFPAVLKSLAQTKGTPVLQVTEFQ
jgi:hypothetical protein